MMKLGLEVVKKNVPKHIAIIPDGNRRWAIEKGIKSFEGYRAVDYEHIESLVLEAKNMGVKYMSLWIFSSENWKRPKSEIRFLFNHFLRNVDVLLEGSIKNKVRVRHIGRKDRLLKKILEFLKKLEEKTKDFDEFNVQLCFDYGGRDEIIRAVNKLLEVGTKKVSEEDLLNSLDFVGIPDPDLIIRTSGEKRTSGLMPFQSTYAELYFEDKYFPDFRFEDLRNVIEEFGRRKRNFGK
jgi:undecaprenyl diphosphate synthase